MCAGESSGLAEQLEPKEEAGYEEPMRTESPVEEGQGSEDVVIEGWCCFHISYAIFQPTKPYSMELPYRGK